MLTFAFLTVLGCTSKDPAPNGNEDSSDTGGTTTDVQAGMGILQFRVKHNLNDSDCLDSWDCDITIEESDDIDGWLTEIHDASNMAVLHYDRAIPWVVFDEDPVGEPVAYYDQRIDPALLGWLDGFVRHFEGKNDRYLAISILSGERNTLADEWVGWDNPAEVAGVCPEVSPGTEITFLREGQSVSFDVQRSFENFSRYLAAKLDPTRLALGVELDFYARYCSDQWPGLVAVYQQTYDALRPELDPTVQMFATLTLNGLLGFDFDQCHTLQWVGCDEDLPNPLLPDADTCFPLALDPLTDLNQGDRLEVLALSFYPDALSFSVSDEQAVLRLFEDECVAQAALPEPVDPLAQLDRLDWDKPIAIAETSSRSCGSWSFIEGDPDYLVEIPGSLGQQEFWMQREVDPIVQTEFLVS